MNFEMKDGKLVITVDVSKKAWEEAKTSAKGNKVLTSGGFVRTGNIKLSLNVIQAQ